MTDQTAADIVEQEIVARFWSKVDRRSNDECWPWLPTYGVTYSGRPVRGQFSFGGRRYIAPRIAYWIHHGRKLPEGIFACHSCDNPNCVNPAHIWPGTQRDNVKDMIAKRRHGMADLTKHNNARKTHCLNGHPFSGENVAFDRKGFRSCRQCIRDKGNASRERKQQRLAGAGDQRLVEMLVKTYAIAGRMVSAGMIACAIDVALAASPSFQSKHLTPLVLPNAEKAIRQRAVNYMMQLWRKMGLAEFEGGSWTLTGAGRGVLLRALAFIRGEG